MARRRLVAGFLFAVALFPLPARSAPRSTGSDLIFQLPYQAVPSPASQVLAAPTSIQYLDLYLLVDRTGSMSAEISALGAQFVSTVLALQCTQSGACAVDADCPPGEVCFGGTCTTLPSSPACAPSIFTGVGRFDDCNTYVNLVSLQSNPTTTENNVPSVGGGSMEAPFQAVARVGDPALVVAPLDGALLEIAVFDIHGRLVRTLAAEPSANRGTAVWDARDAAGARVRAGVYHLRMRTGTALLTRKVTITD